VIRERGFINASELDLCIQHQLFHSHSKTCNDRGFCLEQKSVVGLENTSVSKLGYQEWIPFCGSEGVRLPLFEGMVSVESTALACRNFEQADEGSQMIERSSMRDNRQSQKGQAQMKLSEKYSFDNSYDMEAPTGCILLFRFS
jgi:hypothetical protein